MANSGGYYDQQHPIADFNFDGQYTFFDISAVTSAYAQKTAVGAGWLSDDGASGPGNRIGFMGYHWEPELGMWLGRNRMYSPEAGRWLQRDPAGYVDGLSLYLFVRGNPLSHMDPMGLCASDTPEWNHLLPQEVFEKLDIDDLDINDAEYGVVMEMSDHRGAGGQKKIHDAWNSEWDEWVKKQQRAGREITADMVKAQLNTMRNKSHYKAWLSAGKKASHSYKDWGSKKLGKNGRADWWVNNRPDEEVLRAARKSFSKLAKLMGLLNKAGKVAKPLAAIGLVYAVFVEGVPIAEAGGEALLPPGMSVQDVNNAIGEGQEAFSNVVDNGNAKRATDQARNAGGQDNLEDYGYLLRRGG